MNKLMHGVVLAVFAGACWFLALILKLPMMVLPATARLRSVPPEQATLPAFTRLCMGAGPVLLAVFGLLALGYCIYVWVAQSRTRSALDRVSGDRDVGAGPSIATLAGGALHTAGRLP